MKEVTINLLKKVIKNHISWTMDDLNSNCESEYFNAKENSEDLVHYFNVLDTFGNEPSTTFEKSPNEFNDFFKKFDSWTYVKDYLADYENWEEDIHSIAEENDLLDGEDEVIELLSI